MGSLRVKVLEIPEIIVGRLGLRHLGVRLGLCSVDYREMSA